MLAVVLDVYEGGKDLIPGWKLKEHAENAFGNRWRRRAQAVIRGVPDWVGACGSLSSMSPYRNRG
jgi:hypothetical protein